MNRYLNKSKRSGILAYEAGKNFIAILFTGGKKYLYTYSSAGKINIETMKKLAKSGKGLATYISQHIKDKYEKQLK